MSAKRVYRSAGSFVALLLVAAWPLDAVRATVSDGLCALVNPPLAELRFGHGGYAALQSTALHSVRQPGAAVSSDAELTLGVERVASTLKVGVNLRREFYLPLIIFALAVLVAPVPLRQRATALVLGLPLVFYLCFAGLFATIYWLFAHHAPAVVALSPAQTRLLDAIVGMTLMPPTPRFFIPLFVALVLLMLIGRGRAGERQLAP